MKKTIWKTLAIRLAIAAIVLAALEIAAAQMILSTGLLRSWINGNPETLLLEYDSASSWIPGLIRVRGLRLRGSDPNVQWEFRFEEARVSVSLFDLARRRFHATRVRGKGLTFRLRLKVEPKELSSAHLAALPPIGGFSGDGRANRKESAPWQIHVAHLDTDVSDLWIDIYRYRGAARLTGGFFLSPGHSAQIFPSSVHFLSGTLTLGKETIAALAKGRADCEIESYDPQKVNGDAVWSKISGEISLEGKLPSLRFVNHFLRKSREPRLDGGAGTLRADLRIDHGIGQGAMDFTAGGFLARYADATLRGKAAGKLRFRRWEFERRRLDLSGSRFALSDVTSTRAGVSPDWWGTFEMPSMELLSRSRTLLTARVIASCRDARPLYTLFETELPGWARGILKLEGLTATGRVGVGKELLDLKSFEATGGAFHILGHYHAERSAGHGAFLVEAGPLAVGIEIGESGSVVKLLRARDWYRATTEP